jgi:hypothetical protein
MKHFIPACLSILLLAGCATVKTTKPTDTPPEPTPVPVKITPQDITVTMKPDVTNRIPDDLEEKYLEDTSPFATLPDVLIAELEERNFSESSAEATVPLLVRPSGRYEILGCKIKQPYYDSVAEAIRQTVHFPKWIKGMRTKETKRFLVNVTVEVKVSESGSPKPKSETQQ